MKRRPIIYTLIVGVVFAAVLAFGLVARCQPFPIPATQPTTRPLAVYRQPGADAKKWRDRGVTIAFGWESNGGTVGMTQWETAWTSLGCKVIREPGASAKVDADDDNLLAVLYPVDEPDNVIVATQDAHGDVEAVYKAAEDFYATWHNKKPVVINVGMEQLRWTQPNGKPKVDYARLGRACSWFSCDYYPIQRSVPITDYAMLIDQLAVLAPGKVKLGFVEASNQHLNPQYYPHCRAPTAAEWNIEMKAITDRQMTPGIFPQSIGEDGTGFSYDAMPSDLLTALAAWVSPPAVGPLHGKTAIIDGFPYKLMSP